jgi:DNA-3-methyladenine glycosylase I
MSGYCDVAHGHPLHGPYHDHEYGFPQREEAVLFERLLLEINQAGLSWETMLRKREGFRAAYGGFSVDKVAKYGERDRARLMADAGIIRNRLKIEAARDNARAYLRLCEARGSFCDYLWGFVDERVRVNAPVSLADYPVTTAESDALSKDLKRHGFRFVGSTVIYAHMQATGMVNDHARDCFRRRQITGASA